VELGAGDQVKLGMVKKMVEEFVTHLRAEAGKRGKGQEDSDLPEVGRGEPGAPCR